MKKIWWKFCFINHVTKTFDQEYKFKKLFPTLIVSYKGLLEHIDYQETFLEVKNIKVEKSFWKFFTQETFLKVKKFQELYSNLKKVSGNMNYYNSLETFVKNIKELLILSWKQFMKIIDS